MVRKACFSALAGMLFLAGAALPTRADDQAFIEEVLIVGRAGAGQPHPGQCPSHWH